MPHIRRDLLDQTIAHARAEYPNECCGLLAGRGDVVERVYSLPNADRSPVSFRIDPTDELAVFLEIDRVGLELVGVFHSHTHSAAYPSETDIRFAPAVGPVAQVILSLTDERMPVARVFRVDRSGIVVEEALLVDEEVPTAPDAGESRHGIADHGGDTLDKAAGE